MGQTELLAKIRSDGRDRAAVVERERDLAVAEIRTRLAGETAQVEAESRSRTERETSVLLERARSRARLAARNAVLAARWGVLDKAIALARQRVVADPAYPDMVVALVKKHARPGAEVRLSAADTKRFGSRLPVRVGEPAAIDGGAVIRSGKEEMNFSLVDSLASIREALAAELAQVLFVK
jgi:vacuolar-type H+-ATPase subunit E/Vma4